VTTTPPSALPGASVSIGNLVLLLLVRRLLIIRQRAERQRHRLLLAVMDHAKLHRGARRHRADLARQFARIADRRAVN
jgi:hypothetical protein